MYKFFEERESLFRGKDESSGQWVYGCLLGSDVIVPKGQSFVLMGNKIRDELSAHAVLSETVGQYTGMDDKHGVPIYEGDIVLKRTYHGKKPLRVVFSSGCFHCGWGGGSSTAAHPYTLDDKQIEVIGNIFDTPELLEKKDV